MATVIRKVFKDEEWQGIVRKVRSSSPVSSLVAVHTRDINAVLQLEKPETRLVDHSIDQLVQYKGAYPSEAERLERIVEKKRLQFQFIQDSLEDLAYLNEHIRDPKRNTEITQSYGPGVFVACYNRSLCGTGDDSLTLRAKVAAQKNVPPNRVAIAFRGEYEH